MFRAVERGIVGVVMAVIPKDFYKSMTTHANHRIWQPATQQTADGLKRDIEIVCDEDMIAQAVQGNGSNPFCCWRVAPNLAPSCPRMVNG
ncbi:MAG: type II toxin-antitoxin system MqsR family toxin [Betaproteobacteria bacterium]|nr:type II toxin-antitoxin system MqsR family toxin [Betaproteobacteria bacterium]